MSALSAIQARLWVAVVGDAPVAQPLVRNRALTPGAPRLTAHRVISAEATDPTPALAAEARP